jgi:membrane associated rhomboid family serine protease
VPTFWFAFRGINNSKAIGLAALAGMALENFFSPLFWVLLGSLFALFFMTSRSANTALRVIFFWIPTVTVLGVTGAISGLITLMVIRFRNP